MDKPFLTFEQQIHKLSHDYGLIIGDPVFAKEALCSLSYYDLVNGYQSIYMNNGMFHPEVTMEQLYSMHIFNKNIQGVLLKYSTYVENSFKTLLAYIIAEKYTEHQDEYLKLTNYKKSRDPKDRVKFRELIEKLEDICAECDDTPTKHYRETKDHIPPWILFRNISFSDSADLFKALTPQVKDYLLSYNDLLSSSSLAYCDKVVVTINALDMVRKFRNKIAHNLDFLTYRRAPLNKSANRLFLGSLVDLPEVEWTRRDIWAFVLSIVILLNNKYLVHDFLMEFNSYMKYESNLEALYCKISGIPLDYEDRIKNFIILLIKA